MDPKLRKRDKKPIETYQIKLKHILPTFLLIALTTVAGLMLFRWLFAIRFEIITFHEEVWTLWLPLALPWIPVLIWLRPRFWILTFKNDHDNGRFFFQVIAVGTICACLFISQRYLTTATGKLQVLPDITEIDRVEKARYYQIDNFSVATDTGGSFANMRVSGKRRQYLNIDLYFVRPIIQRGRKVSMDTPPKHWYGVKFHEQINNKLDVTEKEKAYEAFYADCVQKMERYPFRTVAYFERIPNSEDREHYLHAVQRCIFQSADTGHIVLIPVLDTFEDRNGNSFGWIFGSLGIGLAVFLLALIWPGYSEKERKRFLSGKKPKQDDLKETLQYLIPRGDHFATSLLVDINLLVFLLMVFSGVHIIYPNAAELLPWGANRRLEITEGEWWRLLTSMFVHSGLLHLIMNLVGLGLAGIFLEPVLRRKNYLILYILSGICGSLTSIWWHPHTASVGASGAIFGLFGALLGLLLFTDAFPKGGNKGILVFVGLYVGFNLLMGLLVGVDNAAHIGGLLSGALIGILLYRLDATHGKS